MVGIWLGFLAEAVAPRRCRLCGGEAPDGLACAAHALPFGVEGARCGGCLVALGAGLPDGERCPRCRRQPPALGGGLALGDWGRGDAEGGAGPGDPGESDGAALREWVLALKHGGRRDLADPLGRRLGSLLAQTGRGAPDAVLVPVPLHPWRRFERGYDQALELARAAAEASGLPLVRGLRRTRATPPQGAPLSPSRRANVRGAFAAARLGARRVVGREVWLVDDVASSCATASECARVLTELGAERVRLLLLARGRGPRAAR